ncbi:hypothetical protein DFQ26_004760 [Actinomortierella ambigua]|nr:hypothetical protein DFQ26_004760 [Actinomortierella ambigua]
MGENTILSLCFPCPSPAQAGLVDDNLSRVFQQLCSDVARAHHCQAVLNVSINPTQAKKRLSIDTHQSVYNVTLSGVYQNVIAARGTLMRNNPLKPKLSIKVNRASITEVELPAASRNEEEGSKQLKPKSQAQEDIKPCSGDNEKASSGLSSVATSVESTAAATTPDTQPSSTSKPSENAAPTEPATTTTATPAVSNGSTTTSAFSSFFAVSPRFKAAVDEISASTRTSISLISSQFHAVPSARSALAAHARQEMVELVIVGAWENAEAARLLLLVAIDTLQPGIASEQVTIELKYQNMLGGRKRQDLQDLMARTRTNVYLSSPFVQTANKNGSPVDPRYNQIFITGETDRIQIVKDWINKACMRVHTASQPCTRQVNIAARKLDWMLLNHREKLRSIMIDNATFIAFPPLGASHPIIFAYGENRVNVERTIRTVMQLASQFHSGSITMLAPIPESMITAPLNPPSALSPVATVASAVSQASGAEVEFRVNGFFIFGNEIQCRMAVQFLADIDFVKTLHYEVKFSVELSNEQREFISGKKNGKINRIMKATGAKIKFDPCNEYNFYVDLSSNVAVKAVEALAMLQEELPAEISFYVPETYHKRIIGVGGKNIQRIMKKYGVYVKFSNSDEFANLGGYFDNLDNVVARTPSKNAHNLDNLKHAVMEFVNPRDKDFVHHSVTIPKQYYLLLLSDQARALHELQDATNCTVRFPERETGSDTVWISGPESLIQQATSMLLSLVDEQYVYPVPFSEALGRVVARPEFFTEVVDKMKNEWNITLVPPAPRETSHQPSTHLAQEGSTKPAADETAKDEAVKTEEVTSVAKPEARAAETDVQQERKATKTKEEEGERAAHEEGTKEDEAKAKTSVSKAKEALSGKGEEDALSSLTDDENGEETEQEDHVFIFKYSRNNEDYLQNAKELLVQYLIDNQIEVYDDEIHIQRPRSDSFAEAFPHFNSKILSSVAGGEMATPAPAFPSYSLFDNAAGNAFESLTRTSGTPLNTGGVGSIVPSDLRAIFSHGASSTLPPSGSSPPKWPELHSRQHTSHAANFSGLTSASPSYQTQHAMSSGNGNHANAYTRLTSSPIDPWATPEKHSPQPTNQHTPPQHGMYGNISGYRTPTMQGMMGSQAYYSPNGTIGHGYSTPPSSGAHQQPLPQQPQQRSSMTADGPYGKAVGYAGHGHAYSGNNSPVGGVSTNVHHPYGNMMSPHGQQQQQTQSSSHHSSPSRSSSGSAPSSRNSFQFLDEKMMGPAFGPGYGPSLNSSSGLRNQHGSPSMIYQQQSSPSSQQQQHNQYPSHLSSYNPQYPRQRQRHSSNNSAASHHTMFLGAIGGGLGSAGGSVDSDEISEDESDEGFDDLRHRRRTTSQQHLHQQYLAQQQQQQQQQQLAHQHQHQAAPQHGRGSYGMFQPSKPSGGAGSMAVGSNVGMGAGGRRGSLPLAFVPYDVFSPSYGQPQQQPSQLQQQQSPSTPPPSMVRQSASSTDLYGRKSLVNSMSRLSMGQPTQAQHQLQQQQQQHQQQQHLHQKHHPHHAQQHDSNGISSSGRAIGSGILGGGSSGGSASSSGSLNMPNFGPRTSSVFGEGDRDFLSSGIGAIIGGGTISSHHPNAGSVHQFPHPGMTGGNNNSNGTLQGYGSSSDVFLNESALDHQGHPHHSGRGHTNDAAWVGGWDH